MPTDRMTDGIVMISEFKKNCAMLSSPGADDSTRSVVLERDRRVGEPVPPARRLDVDLRPERRHEDAERRHGPDEHQDVDDDPPGPAAQAAAGGFADRERRVLRFLRSWFSVVRAQDRRCRSGQAHAPIISSARFWAGRFITTTGMTRMKIITAKRGAETAAALHELGDVELVGDRAGAEPAARRGGDDVECLQAADRDRGRHGDDRRADVRQGHLVERLPVGGAVDLGRLDQRVGHTLDRRREDHGRKTGRRPDEDDDQQEGVEAGQRSRRVDAADATLEQPDPVTVTADAGGETGDALGRCC